MREDEKAISEWMAGEEIFVFYREPGESVAHGVRASRAALFPLDSIPSLDGKTGFVFAPFRCGKGHPLWLLEAEEEMEIPMARAGECDEVEAPASVAPAGGCEARPSLAYATTFRAFSAALCGGRFRKLVLSRRYEEPLPSGFSWARAFCAACRRYVHSYVYLFHTPQTGYWLGATPEILLTGEGRRYHTVALAGTQFLHDGRLTEEWSGKNLREQACVTQYIMDCLRGRGLEPVAKGPRTATAGELAHLKTEIRFELPDTDRLGGLLSALHPTPAVCGLPKEEAFRFIEENEGYDRSYYAGFLGRLSPGGRTALYVNLRCMACGEGSSVLCLYAGGGLLPESVLEEEWMETERKLQTMKYVSSKGETHVFG